MDNAILVDDYIKDGEKLIKNLDEVGFPVYSTLWYFDPESRTWKLMIATPRVDELGPHETYSQISKYFKNVNNLVLKDIVAVSNKNDFINLLKSAIKTERHAIQGIRFSNNTINNYFIGDAYIYRLS